MIVGIATGLVLVGCGSSGQSAESSVAPSVPVESAGTSGAVAAEGDQPCRSGPPLTAGEGLAAGQFDKDDGVFGTVYNETGSTLWVKAWGGNEKWCRLDAGRGGAFGAGEHVNLLVSTGTRDTPGIRIYAWDPYLMGLPKVKTMYWTSSNSICGDGESWLDTGGLEENEENWLNGTEQGSVVVKRHPDSKSIAREWIGTSKADDWARIDLYVKSIGTCG